MQANAAARATFRTGILLVAMIAVAGALAGSAAAQQADVDDERVDTAPPVPSAASVATAYAGSRAHGRAAVNLAAGSGNAQANVAVMALSGGGSTGAAVGLVDARIDQRTTASQHLIDARAEISGAAFSSARGLLSINQVAGSGNSQANLFAMGQQADAGVAVAIGAAGGLDDAALAAVAGDPLQPPGGSLPTPGTREALITPSAFRGSHGVTQVNQTAGVGNSSANAIVLQLPGGAP
ncbi:MAG: hypothetical protein M3Q40_04690 [Pseudomonadota bacterium]|nr:hypothetical protein [Pseudomonadota bacterium]